MPRGSVLNTMTDVQAEVAVVRLVRRFERIVKEQQRRADSTGAPLPIVRKARKIVIAILVSAGDLKTAAMVQEQGGISADELRSLPGQRLNTRLLESKTGFDTTSGKGD